MIVLSDWSDRKLGLPEIVMDPYHDEAFCAVFGAENLQELFRRLRATTAEEPLIDMEYSGSSWASSNTAWLASSTAWTSTSPSF